jgi:3' terminal RNA ribose 2'-O-methyltransferase Hen1
VPTGTAHVLFPDAGDDRCTAALLLDVDPERLGAARGGRRQQPGPESFALGQYVNDRPYAASSLLSVAIKEAFRTALTGRCASREELAASPIPLELRVPALPCRSGADLIARLFEPLGWAVQARPVPLDPFLPAWGDSRYFDLLLTGRVRLADALNHLYVLLPVLDDAKHYWVSTDEVDKLVRAGSGWLASHPEKELITRRYLPHQRRFTDEALERLAEADETDPESLLAVAEDPEASPEDPDLLAEPDAPADPAVPLNQQRRGAVLAVLRASGARTVADLGCGEGVLVRDLLGERTFERVVATDVSAAALRVAAGRLRLDRMTEVERARLDLFQSSLTYRDDRLRGLDAAVLMEVVEHVDPPRLGALERAVFGHAAPRTVVVTTPNAEHNVRYPFLPEGAFRHRDHRFEWTRAQFRAWADAVASDHGYTVRYLPVGLDDPEVGPPTQMAVFEAAAPAGTEGARG